MEEQLTAADITSFLALFYNAVSTSGLQKLQFMPGPHAFPDLDDDSTPPFRELIAPILHIRDLRSFSFNAAFGIASLDDADIEAIARAWPRLEHLSVARGFTSKSSVSLNAIHCLHRHCAHLRVLSVPRIRWPAIGIDAIPPPLNCSPSHPLRHLSLPKQVVVAADLPLFGPKLSNDDVEAVAGYLFNLFPCLDLDLCRRELDDSKPKWKYLPPSVHEDDRWRKVIGHIYSLCRTRDGL